MQALSSVESTICPVNIDIGIALRMLHASAKERFQVWAVQGWVAFFLAPQ